MENLKQIAETFKHERKLVLLTEIYDILVSGSRTYSIKERDYKLVKDELDNYGLDWSFNNDELYFWSK